MIYLKFLQSREGDFNLFAFGRKSLPLSVKTYRDSLDPKPATFHHLAEELPF